MSTSNKELTTINPETGEMPKFTVKFPVAGTPEGIINVCQYGAFAIKDTKVYAIGASAGVLSANPCIDFTNKADTLEALNRIAEVLHKCGK